MKDYDVSDVFKEMEDYLISSMYRNLERHTNWEDDEGFRWDMWQVLQLESLNGFRKKNKQYVDKQSSYIANALEQLLRKTNENGKLKAESDILNAIKNGFEIKRASKEIDRSFFTVNDRKLKALINATKKDFNKAQYAALRMTEDVYRTTIFKSATFANTGTMTVDQSIDVATKDFLSKGINCIEYSDGKRVNIASYAEMAIKVANKKAYLQGEGSKRQEWGIVTVLVSQYGACSETCLPWQGKVYVDDVWSGGTIEDSERLGYPLLSKAIAKGLFHPNCKHKITTYFEGITTLPSKVDVASTRENSNIIATQRYNERMIRKYKRLEIGSLDEGNKLKYKAKVKEWQSIQRDLLKEHPEVHRNYKRERVVNGISIRNKLKEYDSYFYLDDYNVRMKVYKQEEELSKQSYESAILYDKAGQIILKKDGLTHEVEFTEDEMKLFKNKVLTHNHPKNTTFSPEDIYMLKDTQLQELRATVSTGAYVLKFSDKMSLPTYDVFIKDFKNSFKKFLNIYLEQVPDGMENIDLLNIRVQNANMKYLAKKYNLDYSFEERKINNG